MHSFIYIPSAFSVLVIEPVGIPKEKQILRWRAKIRREGERERKRGGKTTQVFFGVYVCVCEREREREVGRKKERDIDLCVPHFCMVWSGVIHIYIIIIIILISYVPRTISLHLSPTSMRCKLSLFIIIYCYGEFIQDCLFVEKGIKK